MDIDQEAIPAEPPVAGNELDTLLGELERVRGYIAWKCGGLNPAGLRATLGPSTMTLGGLLKHLSACEDHNFSIMLYGRPRTRRGTRSTGTLIRTGSGTRRRRTAPSSSCRCGRTR
jgi:hypothetical protein